MKKVKRMTKVQKIKAMIELNKTNVQIMGAVPTATLQQIYNHRYSMGKNKKVDITPQPDMNIDAHSSGVQFDTPKKEKNKPANEVQVGGTHYKDWDIQPWDAIHEWGLGFFSGNVVKYVARHRAKNGVEDLKKARHYLDKLIELAEAKEERDV